MGFQVIPASVPASADDWRRAMAAPASELPELQDADRLEIKRLSLDEEEYKRLRLLLRQFATMRQAEQGWRFGSFVDEMLKGFGGAYSVSTVSRRGTPLGWRVTIHAEGKKMFEFQCPLDVVDAVVSGRASATDIESFRDGVLSELRGDVALGVAS